MNLEHDHFFHDIFWENIILGYEYFSIRLFQEKILCGIRLIYDTTISGKLKFWDIIIFMIQYFL